MKRNLSWLGAVVALLVAVFIFRDFVADFAFNRSGIIKSYEEQLRKHEKERESLIDENTHAKEELSKMGIENKKFTEDIKLSEKRVKSLETKHKEIFAAPDVAEAALIPFFNRYGYTPTPVSGLLAFNLTDSNSLYKYRDGYDNCVEQVKEKDTQVNNLQESIYGENGYVPQIENLSEQLFNSERIIATFTTDLNTANTAVIPNLKSEVKNQKLKKYLGWGAGVFGIVGGIYLAGS